MTPIAQVAAPAPDFGVALSPVRIGSATAIPETTRVLVATAARTWIYSRPDPDSSPLGYLRSGTTVVRSAEPAGYWGCKRGFYAVPPRGFVCIGNEASLDPAHPLVLAGLDDSEIGTRELPFYYGSAVRGVTTYTRVPTAAERRRVEGSIPVAPSVERWSDGPWKSMPSFLHSHQPSLRSNGTPQSSLAVVRSEGLPKNSFAFRQLFESDGRGWGLTASLGIVPLDRLTPIQPSRFSGLELSPALTLPVAFVREHHARVYETGPGGGFALGRPIGFREAFALSGERRRVSGELFYETVTGEWIRASERVVVVEPRGSDAAHRPGVWIDVSLSSQTLVVYRDDMPIYTTLVSTGRGGLQDAEYATIEGVFRIHTKHVSKTMRSDVEGDEHELQEVPHTQFFKDGYALHAAYWHDDFGVPKSNGCVNLSPTDARRIFELTEPTVPEHWHGAQSLRGSVVEIRP